MKEEKTKKLRKHKKFDKVKFRKRLSNYLVTFVSIFTTMVVSYVSVSLFVFDQFNIYFYYLVLIAIVALIESLLIELFVRINKISVFGQMAVIYATCAISSFLMSFTIDSNIITNVKFWIFALPGSFVGFIVLCLIVYLNKRSEEKALNENLNRFKGNSKNEK